jgi:hypothetical protein
VSIAVQSGSQQAAYTGIYQEINFSANNLAVDVLPTINTQDNQSNVMPRGLNFKAGNYSLTIGFSNSIDEEQVLISSDGNSMLVMRPAVLGQWSRQTINLTSYWDKAGWTHPQSVYSLLLISADYSEQGSYDFYVAGIEEK